MIHKKYVREDDFSRVQNIWFLCRRGRGNWTVTPDSPSVGYPLSRVSVSNPHDRKSCFTLGNVVTSVTVVTARTESPRRSLFRRPRDGPPDVELHYLCQTRLSLPLCQRLETGRPGYVHRARSSQTHRRNRSTLKPDGPGPESGESQFSTVTIPFVQVKVRSRRGTLSCSDFHQEGRDPSPTLTFLISECEGEG